MRLIQQEQYDVAEFLYRLVLQAVPEQPDVLRVLGGPLHQDKEPRVRNLRLGLKFSPQARS